MGELILEGLPAPVIAYIEQLKQVAEEQQKLLEKQQAQIDRLTEMLRLAQKARFGPSSEKSKYMLGEDYRQESLFNEAEAYAGEDGDEPVIVGKHARKPKRTKEELAKDLPVKEVVVTIPEDERKCDICEGDMHPIGRELVRRELCIIPAQAYVTETYRENYACDDCHTETDDANIIKPDVPEHVVKRGLASPSSAAYTMYQKYVSAVPLHRQSKDWETFGVTIPRATLANWMIYTAMHWLLPLWTQWKAILLMSPIILADETVVQVLNEPGKTPQFDSRMWVYCTGNVGWPPPIVLYEYRPSRGGEHPKAFLLDGRIELSTNRVENAIRPFTVGRKNWLFSDTVAGAQASAVAYSVIETAKANGLNPYQYLLHLFTELPAVLTKDPNADLSRFFPWDTDVKKKCRPAKGSRDSADCPVLTSQGTP